MVFSTTTEYAIRGLAEMVSRCGDHSIHLRDIFAGTDLPKDFMAKIFQQLVHGEILTSAKGRDGGFALARPANEITLLNVVEALEHRSRIDRCVLGQGRCNPSKPCRLHGHYVDVGQKLKTWMSRITLADLSASPKARKRLAAALPSN